MHCFGAKLGVLIAAHPVKSLVYLNKISESETSVLSKLEDVSLFL